MTGAKAKRLIVLTTVLVFFLRWGARKVEDEGSIETFVRSMLAILVFAIILSVIAEASPEVAGGLAVLMLVASIVNDGGDAARFLAQLTSTDVEKSVQKDTRNISRTLMNG